MIYYGIKQNQGFNQFNSKIKERKKERRRKRNDIRGRKFSPEPPEPKENDNQYIIDLLEIELKKFYDVAHKLDKSWYDTIYKSYIDNDLDTDQLDVHDDDVDVVIEVRRTIQKLEEETR